MLWYLTVESSRDIKVEVASWVGERHAGTFWASTDALQSEETDRYMVYNLSEFRVCST